MKVILRILLAMLVLICAAALLAGAPEPPAVTAKSADGSVQALVAGYHWSRGWTHAVTDGVHPLDAKEHMPCLTATDGKVTVSVRRRPDSVQAVYWAWDETFSDANADGTELPVSDLSVTLPEGDWIVCFKLNWKGKWVHGHADYVVEVRRDG